MYMHLFAFTLAIWRYSSCTQKHSSFVSYSTFPIILFILCFDAPQFRGKLFHDDSLWLSFKTGKLVRLLTDLLAIDCEPLLKFAAVCCNPNYCSYSIRKFCRPNNHFPYLLEISLFCPGNPLSGFHETTKVVIKITTLGKIWIWQATFELVTQITYFTWQLPF